MDWTIFQLMWQALNQWAFGMYGYMTLFMALYWPFVLLLALGLIIYGWQRSGYQMAKEAERRFNEDVREIAEMRARFAPEPTTRPLVQEPPCRALVEARAVVRERWNAPRESEQ